MLKLNWIRSTCKGDVIPRAYLLKTPVTPHDPAAVITKRTAVAFFDANKNRIPHLRAFQFPGIGAELPPTVQTLVLIDEVDLRNLQLANP